MARLHLLATRLRRWLAPSVLASLMGVYVTVFGILTWNQQSRFATFGFDMGIFDQGIWLLSRFKTPFVTVRGLNYFGNHVNVITVLFVPFYWLGAGPHFLYFVETLALAAGAIPIWLLARDRFTSAWPGVVIAAAYLLNPSIEWINWWHFHPDALAVAPLLYAYLFASRQRWGWFALSAGACLLCKEDAAMAVAALGVVLIVRRHWRAGLMTAGAAVGWFVICQNVIINHANGGLGAFYSDFYGGLGNSAGSILFNSVRHPSRVWHLVAERHRRQYYLRLLGPFAFVPLLAPLVLFIGAPHLLVNSISLFPNTYDIHYQYSALITATLAIACVESCARLRRKPRLLGVLLGVVVAAAVLTNVRLSPSPIGREYGRGIWAARSSRQAVADRAIHMVPSGAGVAASYSLVPHLTHRVHIYEWPNPWIVTNWGVQGEHPPNVDSVDYLVLDLRINERDVPLYESLIGPGGDFTPVFSDRDFVVAKRVRM